MSEHVPEQLGGRYRILGRLGKGAMGIVYSAHDPVLDRRVAIKQMSPEIAQHAELRQRFQVEARAAAQLNHPNIITVHEFQATGPEIYIVMEWLEGRSLADVVRGRSGVLPTNTVLDIMAQVCDGLDYAHERAIVHRDIKPANLFLLSSTGVVKILDFGIARLGSLHMTATGAVLGTPDYMAPEQVRGDDIDRRADLWAVGAVLYELLSGAKPFDAKPLAKLLTAITQSPHVPLQQRAPSVPAPLCQLVDRLLSKPRDQRPATAGLVRDELRAILGRENAGSRWDLREPEEFEETIVIRAVPTDGASGSVANVDTVCEGDDRLSSSRDTGDSAVASVPPLPPPPAAPPVASPALVAPPPVPAPMPAPPVVDREVAPPPPVQPPPERPPSVAPPAQEAKTPAKKRSVVPLLAMVSVVGVVTLAGIGGAAWWLLSAGGSQWPQWLPWGSKEPVASNHTPVAANQAPPAGEASASAPNTPARNEEGGGASETGGVSASGGAEASTSTPTTAPSDTPVESPSATPATANRTEITPERAVTAPPATREEPHRTAPTRVEPDPPRVTPQPDAEDRPSVERPTEEPRRRAAAPLTDDTVSTFSGRRSGGGVGEEPTAIAKLAAVNRITYVLRQYAAALEQRSADALRAVRPSVAASESRLLQATRLKVSLDGVTVDVDGTEATARCRRTVEGTSESGATIREQASVVFHLTRRPSGWVITDVR